MQGLKFLLPMMAASCLCSAAVFAAEPTVVTNVGFATPEAAEYFAAQDTYLVTNINGHPAQADGNGFISRLSPEGKVLELKWIDGEDPGVTLNAPKGMAIVGKRLFVTDLNQVRIFQLPEGGPLGSVAIPGSDFLNGITPAGDGSVLVTDTGVNAEFAPQGTDAVYKVWPDGTYETLLRDSALNGPNGIWPEGEGFGFVSFFGDGKLYHYDAAGEPVAEPLTIAGGLDGMHGLADGSLLITGWQESALYRVDKAGKVTTLMQGMESPADIGFDDQRNRVLIPLLKKDSLVILPLAQ